MTKLFVWDFHGVLEKNVEFAAKEITNRVLKEFGVKKRMNDIELIELYGEPWINFFKRFSPGSNEEELEAMNTRAYEISKKERPFLKYIEQMDFAEEVLTKIKQSQNINILLSNSSDDTISIFSDSVKLTHLFDEIIGVDNYEERITKSEAIKIFIKDKDFEEIIVIGDHPMDIIEGRKVKAVTYLFSKIGVFPKTKADFNISDLREVLKEV